MRRDAIVLYLDSWAVARLNMAGTYYEIYRVGYDSEEEARRDAELLNAS